MKKTRFIMGITLAVVLTAMGCSNPTGSSRHSNGNLGSKPSLTGSIYNEKVPSPSDTGTLMYKYDYEKVSGSGELNASTGGSGAITSGDFTIKLEDPSLLTHLTTDALSGLSGWKDVHIDSKGPVYYAPLVLTVSRGAAGDIKPGMLSRVKKEVVQQLVDTGTAAASEKTIETTTVQEVIYCYVTADVTITGGEKTVETVLGRQTIYKSFRLRLKSGWNAIYHKEVHVAEGTITPVEKTRTVTLDVTNPDLYWVLP